MTAGHGAVAGSGVAVVGCDGTGRPGLARSQSYTPHDATTGMDVEVTVYGPLRSATGTKQVTLSPDGGTVRAVVRELRAEYPRTESQLLDDDGALRPSVRVTVDGETADLDDPYPPGAAVAVFPAMRGG